MEKASIWITGDLVLDRNAVRFPEARSSYRTPCPVELERQESGGAWYLADFLAKLLPAGAGSPECPGRNAKVPAARALSVWELLPQKHGEKNKDKKCWRISEFIGSQHHGAVEDPATFWRALEKGGTLVLDDVGLSFAGKGGSWETAVARRSLQSAGNIVGKIGTLDAPLWQWLLNTGNLAGKLTLVITAASLREMGARISRSLSWDSAISDLIREMAEGRVGSMLAPCRRVVVLFGAEGVATFSRESRAPEDKGRPDRLRFEQFIFDPIALEDAVASSVPGKISGSLSVLAATVAATVIASDQFPRFVWLSRALAALQDMKLAGAGTKKTGPRLLAECINDLVTGMLKPQTGALPENRFGVAFPRELLDEEAPRDTSFHSNETLLTDLTGVHPSLVRAKAEEIVLRGPKRALGRAPCAKYGNYITYDRDEIERINSLRNLISDYVAGDHPRPLSVAVFGQPGSGKSFAIKELAKELFPGSSNAVTFNLSQFESLRDLHAALHQVRDMVLGGGVPLVFWDEFDTGELRWLKDFLAPMQDGEFNEHGRNHPIGRAIFVFAGGTAHQFADFHKEHADNKAAKAPDFISRLRGYVDIKGPNRVSGDGKESIGVNPSNVDQQYVIRRALLLRVFLEKYAKKSVFDGEGSALVAPGVLKGLLFVEEYSHGARSMESIVSQSHLLDSRGFGPSELPPKELLDLHLSPDFMKLVDDGQQLSTPHGNFADELAIRLHEAWRIAKEADGWTYGEKRDDVAKTNPYLLPYDQLDEEGRERNLGPARVALARLEALALRTIPRAAVDAGKHSMVKKLQQADLLGLARIEHQRWMRERLMQGYVYGRESNDDLRQHRDIRKFEHLSRKEAKLDFTQIDETLKILEEMGVVLVREKKKRTK